jgi:hypothetical protein
VWARVLCAPILFVGYGEGPAVDWLLDKFKAGDAWTLDQVRASFAGKTPAPAKSAPDSRSPSLTARGRTRRRTAS